MGHSERHGLTAVRGLLKATMWQRGGHPPSADSLNPSDSIYLIGNQGNRLNSQKPNLTLDTGICSERVSTHVAKRHRHQPREEQVPLL